MLTLHHLTQSRSFRIVWLLEELKNTYGIEYQLITHKRNHNFLAPDDLKRIHPMGKAPILVDDSLPQGEQVLAESALIVEYLLKYYDKNQIFMPKDEFKSWRDYQFWLHFAESSLMPPLVMGLILTKTIAKAPFVFRPIATKIKAGVERAILQRNVALSLDLLEQQLQGKSYLVDDKLTGADIQLYFAVMGAKKSGVDFEYPNICAWLEQCQNRPAFEQAVAVAGGVL